jgi:ubiquinone/menaquinone biosynthesis C-methylase UbiE
MNDPAHVREQYSDPANLDARSQLHHRFSTNGYPWFAWVFDRLDLGPHARVLEVGCGPGGIWSSERSRVPDDWRVVLTDLSLAMARKARTNIADERFAFLNSDAQFIPLRDGSFDAVIANHMLYHVPDLAQAVAELARVLVPGGRLFAATNGTAHMMQLRRLLRQDTFGVTAFSLETGPTALETHFSDIAVERYPDALDVTDAEAVVAYVRSMATFWRGAQSEEDLREHVESVIEREGVFRIDKDAGLITAVRK